MSPTRKELASRLSTALKGGEGSGNHGHAGRPGEVGGSAPAGNYRGLSSEAMQEIESGVLDIPKNVKKRRYQTKDQDPEMMAYAKRVWESVKAEMKRQGVSDDDIKSIEDSIHSLLRTTDSIESKQTIGALMANDGASDDEIRQLVIGEMSHRYKPGAIDAALSISKLLREGKTIWDKEVYTEFMVFRHQGDREAAIRDMEENPWNSWEATLDQMKYDRDRDPKRFEEDGPRSGYGSFVDTSRRIGGEIDEIANNSRRLSKGMAIVRDYSRALYERNAESDTLYRGIYDFVENPRYDKYYSKDDSGEHYWPVKSICAVFHPNFISGGGPKPLDDVVTFGTDRLTAWTVSKQIARTFSAGGGRKGENIHGKAMLSRKVNNAEIAFYWPVIYAHLGMSIDTKEVWLQNTGHMTIKYDEFELV